MSLCGLEFISIELESFHINEFLVASLTVLFHRKKVRSNMNSIKMTNFIEKYWNMDYLTEQHLAGFDNYKVSH